MAINYGKWLDCVQEAVHLSEDALNEIEPRLLEGLTPSRFSEEGEERYGSGILFFDRAMLELHTALSIVGLVNEGAIKGNDIASQRLLDELLSKQRKLFESLLVVIMLSRDVIWVGGTAQDYFLHLHLVHDHQRYRLLNADMKDFFGKTNEFATQSLSSIEGRIKQLPINLANCTWSTNFEPASANTMFKNVIKTDATQLERAALGITYRSLFGISSDQIHFNLSRFHLPTPSVTKIIDSVENVALLCVCIVLRLVDISRRLDGNVGSFGSDLISRYATSLPNSCASAVLGPAVENDLVVVFRTEGSGNFIGRVTEKKFRGITKNTAYEIERLRGGRKDWFGSVDLMLLLPASKQQAFLEDAHGKGFITTQDIANLDASIEEILENPLAVSEMLNPLNDHLPTSFFVQEYRARETNHDVST